MLAEVALVAPRENAEPGFHAEEADFSALEVLAQV
jgi:hypothetical protein